MASPSYVECYVFIDDSNLWIAGQKARGKGLEDSATDPRFRVDLGRFMDLVAKKRDVSKAFLYGSVPPPNDTVWNAAKKKNYEVKTFKRSGAGREKEVDATMTSDIMEELYETENVENVTFIIVTGDRDFKSPIEKCLKKNVSVELWSWEDSMAVEFKRLANTSSLFTAKKLDDVQDQFGYTAVMSTHDKKDIDPAHAIVYRNVPKGKKFAFKLADYLARLSRIFYITPIEKETNCDLIVEFVRSKPDYIMKRLEKLGDFDYRPCSYPEYNSPISELIKTTTYFRAMTEIEEESFPEAVTDSMSLDISDIASEEHTKSDKAGTSDVPDDWTTMVRRKPGLLTTIKKQREKPCIWGDHCMKATNCLYNHTEHEKRLFAKYPKLRFKYFKVKECIKKDLHVTEVQKKMCSFAHDNEDSWCLECKAYGHLTQNCTVGKKNVI